MNFYFKSQQGFIALISAITIAAIFIVVTFALSTSGFFLRFDLLGTEFKKNSLALSEACVQKAMLDLANGSLVVPQTVPVGSSSCKICDQSGGSPVTIKTRAASGDTYSKAYTNLTVQLTQDAYNNFTVNSWIEAPVYAGPACSVP